jgi:hypothetical protein
VIAEVGAWSNPLSSDPDTRAQAIEKCIRGLELADRIGAICCVNTAGSRGTFSWYGPHPANLTEETFEMIVETTRKIIDAVRPTRSVFALEPMPWIFPDSPASYLRLIKAIDRRGFGVHLDPVNMINSPALFFDNTALLRECFRLLGEHIRCCHAKDMILGEGRYSAIYGSAARSGSAGLPYLSARAKQTRRRYSDAVGAFARCGGIPSGCRPHSQCGYAREDLIVTKHYDAVSTWHELQGPFQGLCLAALIPGINKGNGS